jgi:hypothetical protein
MGRGAWAVVLSSVVLAATITAPITTAHADPCGQQEICIQVDGRSQRGPARLPAQGFLWSIASTNDPAMVAALRPQHWRLADTKEVYDRAKRYESRVTVMLSDFWYGATNDAKKGGAQPPWNNWSQYAEFIKSVVRQYRDLGKPVDYWDIQNEPGGDYVWTCCRGTTQQLLDQYRVAHDAIRSVDPEARIVGPSLGAFADGPGQDRSWPFDLERFFRFVEFWGLRFDAISWHEISAPPPGAKDRSIFITSPRDVIDHIARVRKLLAAHPRVGKPEILINEYGVPSSRLLPGWTAGWLGAFEQANVDGANRACAMAIDTAGRSYSECARGVLDGLLIGDEKTPQANYWVHRAYADMTGERLATSSSDDAVTAFATAGPDGTVRVLLGRHKSCTRSVNSECTEPSSATPPPKPAKLTVSLPGTPTSVRVSIRRIPNVRGPMRAPIDVQSSPATGDVVDGALTVNLDAVADGEAYVVTVRPR